MTEKQRGKEVGEATGKVSVFCFLKRGGKVDIKVIANTQSTFLIPIIRRMILFDISLSIDTYTSYDVLDESQFKA